MRVHLTGDKRANQFAQQLLEMGNGSLNASEDGQLILMVGQQVSNMQQLMAKVFPRLQDSYFNQEWLCHQAILAPRNAAVDEINVKLLEKPV